MANGEAETSGDAGGSESSGSPSGFIPVSIGKRKRRKNSGATAYGLEAEASSPVSENRDDLEAARFIGLGLVSLVELAETFIHGAAENRVAKKRPSKLEEFRQMARSLALKDQEKELTQKSAEKIAKKYEWMTKYAPELVLGVTLSQYSLRQLALLKFVEAATKDEPRNEPKTADEASTPAKDK